MKFQTLPVRRRPAPKGIFHRLSAVTRNRRQRVSASATMAGMEMDDGGTKISRNLTIIFMIHIVAIALIFIHQRFLEGRPDENSRHASRAQSTPAAAKPAVVTAAPAAAPVAMSGKTHITKDGETYASIATAFGVAEQDLRQLNGDAALRKGLILKIPAGKAVSVAAPVATTSDLQPVAEAVAATAPAAASEDGMVEAVPVDVSLAPKAKAVAESPTADAAAQAKTTNSGKTHLVKKGDTIVKIAKQYKVSQDDLMRANSITDPTKLKAGANLVIP